MNRFDINYMSVPTRKDMKKTITCTIINETFYLIAFIYVILTYSLCE